MADSDLYARLLAKAKPSESGCLEWTACRLPRGYGAIQYKRKKLAAHRAMWSALYGTLPSHIYVCHRCDNPLCINPEHLFAGTAKDNNTDRAKKGRSFRPKGQLNPMSKFSDEKIAEIMRRYKDGERGADLAKEIGCSYGSIIAWARKSGLRVGVSGARNGRSVLSESSIIEIRERLKSGESQMSISRAYGVSGHSIWRIANGRGWK